MLNPYSRAARRAKAGVHRCSFRPRITRAFRSSSEVDAPTGASTRLPSGSSSYAGDVGTAGLSGEGSRSSRDTDGALSSPFSVTWRPLASSCSMMVRRWPGVALPLRSASHAWMLSAASLKGPRYGSGPLT